MYEEILDQMQELLKDEMKNFGDDLGKLEQAIMEMMMSLGKGLLQRLVDSDANGYKGSSTPCECNSSMKFVQHRPRDIHSLFGWIKIKRAYYHCPDCGTGLAPYDKSSGLGSEQLSPGLAKACCLLAVDDSFAQTSRKLEELFGQKVSERTVERVVHQVGSVVLTQQDEELNSFLTDRRMPQAEANPERLYVAADGTTAHETDGWHEVKVGSIYWKMSGLNALDGMLVGLTIQKSLVGICGWRLFAVDCVRLKRLSFWAMEPVGFVTNDVSILVVPRLSSIGITPWNTSGIAAKFFLAKVVKLRKNGSRNVKVGSGMDRHGNC